MFTANWYFARLLEDEESARDNHVLAFNFAKYSLIKKNSLAHTQQ